METRHDDTDVLSELRTGDTVTIRYRTPSGTVRTLGGTQPRRLERVGNRNPNREVPA